MHDVQHISVYIVRQPAEVYEFASDPRNLPRWAAGLARSEVRKDGDEWVADAPFGKVRNGEGSECVFTLIRQPGCPTGGSRRTSRRSRTTLRR
jgi:uncharacterized protein YndB with AHSA1/START domain